jgi:imidazolonepropionase-like amidohydrolase
MKWVLFKDGKVIDGLGNEPALNTSVLVRGNRIHTVSADLTEESVRDEIVPRDDTLTVVDATDRTVMPGLIDGHCHFSFGHPRSQEEMDLYTPVEIRTLRTAWNAKRILRAGVTSVSQPGGAYYIGVGVREAVGEGIVEGPRIFTAGRQMSTSNGIGDYYPDTVGVPDGSVGTLANTPDEMKRQVRIDIKNGVDFIKVADSPFGEFQAFTDDELKMICDLAHQMKTPVAIHARGNDETKAAIRAGVDWIMHSNIMDDEAVDALAESKIPLVPALSLLANWADFGHLVGVPVGLRDACKGMLEKSADSYARATAAGVQFGMGAESGFAITPCGEWHAREIELLADYAGLTQVQAIQTATSNAALTVGLEGEVGVIQAGMLADIIVVNGDPATDIRALQRKENIEVVMKDGEIVDFSDEERLALRPYAPAQIFQTEMLMFSTVYGDTETPESPFEPMPWSADDGKDLANDIRKREVIVQGETSSSTGAPRVAE